MFSFRQAVFDIESQIESAEETESGPPCISHITSVYLLSSCVRGTIICSLVLLRYPAIIGTQIDGSAYSLVPSWCFVIVILLCLYGYRTVRVLGHYSEQRVDIVRLASFSCQIGESYYGWYLLPPRPEGVFEWGLRIKNDVYESGLATEKSRLKSNDMADAGTSNTSTEFNTSPTLDDVETHAELRVGRSISSGNKLVVPWSALVKISTVDSGDSGFSTYGISIWSVLHMLRDSSTTYLLDNRLHLCDKCERHCLPRSKHCDFCQRCTTSFDHHCPWFGVCISRSNLLPSAIYLCLEVVELTMALVQSSTSLLGLVTLGDPILIFLSVLVFVLSFGLAIGCLSLAVQACCVVAMNLSVWECSLDNIYRPRHSSFPFTSPYATERAMENLRLLWIETKRATTVYFEKGYMEGVVLSYFPKIQWIMWQIFQKIAPQEEVPSVKFEIGPRGVIINSLVHALYRVTTDKEHLDGIEDCKLGYSHQRGSRELIFFTTDTPVPNAMLQNSLWDCLACFAN